MQLLAIADRESVCHDEWAVCRARAVHKANAFMCHLKQISPCELITDVQPVALVEWPPGELPALAVTGESSDEHFHLQRIDIHALRVSVGHQIKSLFWHQ